MEVEASVAEESQLHELQSRIDELERLHEADQIELRALRESEEAANSQLQDIKTENERLQQQSGDDKEAGKNAKQDRERVETEKRELLEALARSDGDKASLEDSLKELREAHSATQASLRSLESSHSAATENERSFKLKLQAVEGELSIVKKDRDWNHGELQRVLEESSRDRREKNAQLSRLQTQLDSATQLADSSTSSLTSLRSSHASLETRLNESLTRVAELTSQLADAEASFRSEISTSQRLNELLQKREEDTKERLDQVEKEWEAAQTEMQTIRDTYAAEVDREKARADALDERVREMRDFADNLAAGGNASTSVSYNESSDVFGTPLPRSPSASTLAIKLQKAGGRSYTEVYTSYIKMQEELTLERAESKRLSEALNDILQEIHDRAPLLKEQRNEYERATAENDELSVALARALEEKDELQRNVEEYRLQGEQRSRETLITSQQLDDSTRQVRSLIRRIAALEDPTIADRSKGDIDQDMTQDGDTETANEYISNHLVTFRSINQLQAQNQKLLKIVRELGAKMEAEEAALRARVDRAENSAVEEAHDLIIRLKEEVQSQRAQMSAYQRERDMLRQVLKNRGNAADEDDDSQGHSSSRIGNASSQSALDEVNKNFEAYKREMVIDNQSLRDDVTSARREASQLQIELARANANRELLQERFKTTQDTLSRQDKELADLTRRNYELQGSLGRQDDATRRVTEELLDLKTSLDSAKRESMMLRAEKEVWKNVEIRLSEDNANLSRERTHLSDLMRNLQAMHNELERSGSEARSRLESNSTRLQSELDSLKERLSQETENVRQINQRKELETRDLQARIDKLTTEYHEAREALLNAKNKSERSEERAEAAARQVAAYEEKLAVYEGRRSQGHNGESSLSREQQLESQVADLRGELSTAKMEAEQAKGHAEQYKAISQAHEETLAELNTTYDQYKQSMDVKIAEKDTEIGELQERINGLTADLTASGDENSELHKKLESQRVTFEQEQQANIDTIANLKAIETDIANIRASAKADLAEQSRRAAEAHEKYQAEVLGHAEDVKMLTALKAQLDTEQKALQQARSLAENAQQELNATKGSWIEQKDTLQRELDEQKKRCDDLISQNSILHNHLDTVSAQAARIQAAAEAHPPTAEDAPANLPSDAKSADELHAVIRYIRREKDVAELRLELSRQQEARLRQELDHANKQLDEKSSELSEERQRGADSSSIASQHAELLEKIQSLNLLRESNETLRRDSQQALNRAQTLQNKLAESEAQLNPLREQVRILSADVEARDRNIKMLEEDNARWKTRTQQILQKYERIDPAELAQLKEELEKVKAQLDEAQKAKEAAEAKANAITTDLNDANTRAEASLERFKKLQGMAREQREAAREAKAKITTMEQEAEQLTAAKAELEQKLAEAQTSSSSANDEALAQLRTEKDEVISKLEAEKQELSTAKDQATQLQEETEAARKKLEEENAAMNQRNGRLLTDNKNFHAQNKELRKTQQDLTDNMEEQIKQRIAELPASTNGAAAENASGDSDEATAAKLKELEDRLNGEKEAAVQSAISDTTSRLQNEFEKEKARLQKEFEEEKGRLAAESGSAGNTSQAASVDDAEIQRRAEEIASVKVEEAVKVKEEEVEQATNSELQEARRLLQEAQARIEALTKSHQEALQNLQKEYDEKLAKAVSEAQASAAATAKANGDNAEPGEVQISQEDVDKAVKEALESKEKEHTQALTAQSEQLEKKLQQQFELKNKLRENQITALRKEAASLKSKLAQAQSEGSTAPAASPTASSAAANKPVIAVAGAAGPSTPSPAKGLSIAGRSQSTGAVTRGAGAGRGAGGLSIQGSAAGPAAITPGAETSPDPAAVAGAGRGRGRGRGRGAPGAVAGAAGRGRGALVNTALSAATEAGAKRAREEETPADTDAKRRKDGEAA